MARNSNNPLHKLVYVPTFRQDPWPFSRPLYDFLFRSWGYKLLEAWLPLGWVISSLNYLILSPIGFYVLKVGLSQNYYPSFPYWFWLGGIFVWVVSLSSLGDITPHHRDFHEQHLVRKISLLISGVGGVIWAVLWMKQAYVSYYVLEDFLGWFYKFMESPWYTFPFLGLSVVRLLAVYAWVGAVTYRVGAVAFGSGQGQEGDVSDGGGAFGSGQGQEGDVSDGGGAFGGWFSKKGKGWLKEADKDPRPGEKDEIVMALRKEVVLPPKVEEEVAEVILSLKHYRAFKRRFGTNPPRGILLVGPPGTGKTSVARFIAKHAGLNFIAPSPGDLRSKWLGESAARIAALFDEARRSAPCVLFIDELDAVAPKRGGHEEVHHAVGQLLQELDGISTLEDDAPVVLVGASNHEESIDPAVLSRIGATLTIPLPGPEERRRILTILLKEHSEAVDLSKVIGATEGFSGRDLQTIVTRAQRKAFTEGRPYPSTEDLLAEVQVIWQGRRRAEGGEEYDPRLFKRFMDGDGPGKR